MADGAVGDSAVRTLIQNHRAEISAIVTTSSNRISELADLAGIPTCIFGGEAELISWIRSNSISFEIGLMIWWPRLLTSVLLDLPEKGFFNTHPSFLPHNRGKSANFWAIVEKRPYGVSIHRVDKGIDSGSIVAQRVVSYDWTDTGETLYRKGELEMIELIVETFPILISDSFDEVPQNPSIGSFHTAAELDSASLIDLNRRYLARDLLNLLRARTFAGHPACQFSEDGNVFEVTIQIKRIS